jgi:hypothetical protein
MMSLLRKFNLIISFVFVLLLFSSLSCSHYRTIPGSNLSSLSLLRRIVQIKSDSTSILIGQVLDRDSDEPIFGVNIVINDLMFGSTTDTTGNYIIKEIPKGTYKIKSSWIGYKTSVLDSIVIEGGELIILDFRLAREEMQIYDCTFYSY